MKLTDLTELHAGGQRLAVLEIRVELEKLPAALQKLPNLEVPEPLTAALEALIRSAEMHRDVCDAERAAELAALQPPQEPPGLPPPPAAPASKSKKAADDR